MTDQDDKKPDFSNVTSGSSSQSGSSGQSGGADFSNVVSGSSSTAASPAGAPSAERIYVVVRGDSLSKIAKTFYGNANSWKRIFEANRDVIHNPDLIQPGWKLRIPE